METYGSFDAEFSFNWKIKNFSHCFPWTMVRSPTFTVESMEKTRWCLHIWPKEYTNGIHMEYYLAREEVDSGPEYIRVAFELSFLDSEGIQLVKKNRDSSFARDTFKGFPEFVRQAAVFTERRLEYLPDDTLTARCEMRQIGRPPQKAFICSATSVIGVKRSSFYWNIENFSIIRPGRKRSIEEDNPFVKMEFTLTARPEEALQFEIYHDHMDQPNMTDCEISVMDAFKHAVYFKKDCRYLEGKVWKFPIFVKKSQLTAKENVCLQEDILALKCNISISLGVVSSVIDGYRRGFSFRNEILSKHFKSYLITDKLSSSKDAPSIGNEANSSTKELVENGTSDVQKLFTTVRKNVEKARVEFSEKSSSSSMNESFLPTRSQKSSITDKLSSSKDSPSISNEANSSSKELVTDGKSDVQKLLKNVRKNLVKARVEVSDGSSSSSFSPPQSEESSSAEDEALDESDDDSFSLEEVVPTSSMKSELLRFYQDGTFCDISLIVGKDAFPAHKLILCLRSGKFKEILTNDLSKKSIKLTDLDSETLRDILDFIYTNNAENLTWVKAQKLYLAAENYQVPALKNACYVFMEENINETSACDALILADEQQDEKVKQLAMDFIVKHGKAIINTQAWDELSKKHIKLAFETMQQMFLNKT